ncbi:MAG: triose-phosphate isomerase [Ignavibacteriaceae bacterium]|nr:triose-phosphate isomerase [Ignavibacteriaceae bacterium]
MRTKLIAGNWKMNNDLNESKVLIAKLAKSLKDLELNCEVVICPPYTSLSESATAIVGTKIKLGAQNLHQEESGAYTGEVSAKMLLSTGCEYVIIGHSERRTIFKENDELINKKIDRALKNNLKPIFCVGELLEERENNITEKVIESQVLGGLNGFSENELADLIIAYEPVWAIGTGKTATPEQAEDVHKFIRDLLEKRFSKEFAEKLLILYGGSVKPENSKELLSQKNIDGALVGGACLKAESFVGIIQSA